MAAEGVEKDQVTVKMILRTTLGFSVRQIIKTKMRDAGICKNGKEIWVNERVIAGECIEVKLEDAGELRQTLTPLDEPLDILYEDPDMIIVNKPAGIPVHPSKGHYNDTLANMLAAYFEKKKEKIIIRAVGRLDIETSGAVVIAKNQVASTRIQIEKEYVALATGIFEEKTGEICTPIRESASDARLMEVHPDGKYARTKYEVTSEHCINHCVYSILKVHIFTGRTHQIRVHMASIGHSLLGDSFYNHEGNEWIRRSALHAYKIRVKKPFSDEWIEITTPIPKDMLELIKTSK
jgi:23S rRNA pseudouridine1911/1915/1917 synthase